jgi:DNA gyrase subunit A
VEEVPEKKKGAVGVRGIRLAENDALEEIYYLGAENESDTILYKEKEVQLRKLRLGKRDAKGTKIRV